MSHSQTRRRWRRPMVSRDVHEAHRTATPLELLFDLCFVVAIAQVAARLHHGLEAGHAGPALLGFAMVFFAIWWAWMNFTWFASAYDTDDVLYRLLVLVQIVGVLILAAGVPRAFETQDFRVITLGYVVMRVGLITLWLRAARDHIEGRRTARRFALGLTVAELGWIGLLALPPESRLIGFFVLVVVEVSVPLWAERARPTAWHPEHIAERYGLLTLIVLGESVLAATVAIQSAIDGGHLGGAMIGVVVGAPVIMFAMWWLYFDLPAHDLLHSNRNGFIWGYGHLPVFASAAAVGAGLAVAVDHATGHAHIPYWVAGNAVGLPVAVYTTMVWLLQIRPHRVGVVRSSAYPIAALLVLASTLTPWCIPMIAAILVALLVVTATR